jgi:uncharacterized protein YjbI with pentapeptide repeats
MSLLTLKRRAEGLTYEDEVFEGTDLRSMRAYGAKFIKCLFKDCKLDLADLRNTRFDACMFENSSIQRVDFSTACLVGVSFTRCDLEQSSFMAAHLDDVSFAHCRMAYGDTLFQNATVRAKVHLLGCNLHGSNLDFRQVEPGALKMTDCNLWGAKTAFGCAFWQGEFDEKTCQRFLALVARVYPVNDVRVKLMSMAGDQYRVVDRAVSIGKADD